ncbi:hypothetical protein BDQ12DRAFT_91128 [Crucibulum laeve]|uniref:Uncharacterized protein n=1 Tax=Crucibulum laeve TaxID=68775 RepID=A0A5C3M3D0_9AGAR|nr:hypothetical protein BDQ12DRAFT_91128 [Crucibulum laeve]
MEATTSPWIVAILIVLVLVLLAVGLYGLFTSSKSKVSRSLGRYRFFSQYFSEAAATSLPFPYNLSPRYFSAANNNPAISGQSALYNGVTMPIQLQFPVTAARSLWSRGGGGAVGAPSNGPVGFVTGRFITNGHIDTLGTNNFVPGHILLQTYDSSTI